MRDRDRRPRLRTFLATGLALSGAGSIARAQAAPTTDWTGAAGDHQWGNPANWSNGAPDANTGATFYRDFMWETIDLGGVTRNAESVRTGAGIGSLVRLTNGTLSAPLVDALSVLEVDTRLTTDAATLVLRTNLGLTISGPIVGDMDVNAQGRFTGTNTYTGRTLVEGPLTLGRGGEIVASREVVVRRGVLVLENATGDALNGRDVELHAGRVANDWGAASVGQLRLTGGHSQVAVTYGADLAADSIARTPGATVEMTLDDVARDANFVVGTLPPMSGDGSSPHRLPVLPWARVGARSFVTYDDAQGFRPLEASEYAPALSDGANVLLSGDATRSSDVSVNTLSLDDATLTLENGAGLTVAGGGMVLSQRSDTGTARITGTGSLALTAEGVVHTAPASSGSARAPGFTIDVPISGGMLTKAGPAPLALTRRNTYSGGTTINQGTVRAMAPGSLGTGPVRFAGGSLTVGYADGTIDNDLVLDSGPADFSTVSVPRAGTTTFAGTLSGSGELTFVVGFPGGGTIRLAGGGAAQGDYEIRAVGGVNVILDGNFASPQAVIGSTNVGPGPTVIVGDGTFRGRFDGGAILLSPGPLGDGPGRLTFGQAELDISTVYHVDIAGRAAGTEHDQLVVLDRLFLGSDRRGDLEVLLDEAFDPAAGDRFTVIDNQFAGPVEGTFRNLPEGARLLAQGTPLQISYVGGDGNDVTLTVVPEPGAAALGFIGSALVLLWRRRREQ